MRFLRLPMRDPRTVARDIPGVCDILFPRLLPGLVGLLNRKSQAFAGIEPISPQDMRCIKTNAAMLFEIAFARAEQTLSHSPVNIEDCIQLAINRQSKYFDAKIPSQLTDTELAIIDKTSDNLARSLHMLANGNEIVTAPQIFGFDWISNGVGDFSAGDSLIEVKCTSKGFSSNDYRQLLIYWLLSYASAIEKNTIEWKRGVLLNPRLNHFVEFDFDELIHLVTGGVSKVEVLELFRSVVSEYSTKLSIDSFGNY
ncbi:hypothetical protein Q4489_07255 [Thalassotalea sp. 1_MG-2023]|uniref:hypothetical protein n=1 Tax=Thalassotalea sp. 1_MG-2023 TaxID=3062680 RepID=UPI0026E28E60|nr:hypothetical protein [Thalassotalea sp. 1_MG-2023]MDO6426804.1 hypothetical protein [Thalassotalea sp. 1_MG-2023]